MPWKPHRITLEFAEYIKDTAKNDPDKIIAIMYSLYGTIMSGGQTNKTVVQKVFTHMQDRFDNIPAGSGVALYEIKHQESILDAPGIASFKMKWHENLCKIETLLPPRKNIDEFRAKLTEEVGKTFRTIVKIIEENVEQGHC